MTKIVYVEPKQPFAKARVPFAPAVAAEACLPPPTYESWVDRLGIWLSGLCMIHCLATPVLLLMLPMFSMSKSEWVHIVLALVLPIVTLAAFVPGYRRHGDHAIIGLGIVGLILIAFAAFDPFKVLNEITESAVTTFGGLALITGHIRNRRLNTCDHPGHAH